MTELYVYYKVSDANAEAALAVLANWPGLPLLKRSGIVGGLQTWMEIHRGPDAETTEQAVAAALTPYVSGFRHVERFEPLRG